jgi:hypothetical protein
MRKTPAPIIAITLLVVIYFAAYYALVTRSLRDISWWPRPVGKAHYRVGGKAASVAFGPAHYLDRKLRPGYWAP